MDAIEREAALQSADPAMRERAQIEIELEFYTLAPPPEFMVEAVERRKVKLRERLAELGPE